jgi:hypothetical protein
MEVRSDDVCVKVDNAKFVVKPQARMTLDGVMAYIDVAIKFDCMDELNAGMLTLLHSVIRKHNPKTELREDDKPVW